MRDATTPAHRRAVDKLLGAAGLLLAATVGAAALAALRRPPRSARGRLIVGAGLLLGASIAAASGVLGFHLLRYPAEWPVSAAQVAREAARRPDPLSRRWREDAWPPPGG